jgi:para-nitrobenzyl esterase
MVSRYWVALLALALPWGAATMAAAPTAAAPIVRVEQGRLQGIERDGMRVFRGVPYAQPPVGEWRWRPPRPAAAWRGVRAADSPSAACAQESIGRTPAFPQGLSEDCLYLNVFAPRPTRGRLPVMLWIHGGSFRWGSAMDPAFDGAALVREGVVVVAINYRLDRLGRFAHPALSASQPQAPLGNYALMDQVAALQWVRRNIASFGGDPRKVTIFGCSAGGVSVDFLMTLPEARGLFQRAIAQSGSLVPEGERRLAGMTGRFTSLEEDGLDFARHFGIDLDASAVARLRALSWQQIVGYASKDASMNPVVDGRLVREDPAAVYQAGRQAPVPIMSGASTYEASLIRPFNLPLAAVLAGMPRASVAAAYGDLDDAALKDLYFGDSLFLSTAAFVTSRAGRAGQRGFLYEYAYINSAQRTQNPGAYHCSETPRIFGTQWRGEPESDEDRRMGAQLRAHWVQFARNGDPGLPGDIPWPENRESQIALMQLALAPQVLENPYSARLKLHLGRYTQAPPAP